MRTRRVVGSQGGRLCRRRRTGVAAALAVGALLLSSCGGDGDENADDPEPVDSSSPTAEPGVEVDLEGTSYLAEEVTGRELVEGTRIRVEFADETMAVRAGCNSMSGAYVVESDDDGTVVGWTSEPVSTLVGCPDDLTEQDRWISELFQEGLTVVEADDDRLVLEGTVDDEEVRLTLGRAAGNAPGVSPQDFAARINGPSTVESTPQVLKMTITNTGDRRDTFKVIADPEENGVVGPRFFTLGVRQSAKFRVRVTGTPLVLKVEGRRAGRYVETFAIR